MGKTLRRSESPLSEAVAVEAITTVLTAVLLLAHQVALEEVPGVLYLAVQVLLDKEMRVQAEQTTEASIQRPLVVAVVLAQQV
jgi:hypothetical protein